MKYFARLIFLTAGIVFLVSAASADDIRVVEIVHGTITYSDQKGKLMMYVNYGKGENCLEIQGEKHVRVYADGEIERISAEELKQQNEDDESEDCMFTVIPVTE